MSLSRHSSFSTRDPRPARRPEFERLDDRICMSVEATYDAGVLAVRGTDGPDSVLIQDFGDGKVKVQDRLGAQSWEFEQVRQLEITTGDGDDQVGVALLLPAVQKVREAAARMQIDTGFGDDRVVVRGSAPETTDLKVSSGPGDDAILIGLLLPAVQKVREAAATDGPTAMVDVDSGAGDDHVQVGLLLPAVQKVREAAARMHVDLGPGNDRASLQATGISDTSLDVQAGFGDDDVSVGLLLPAVQKVREAAARMRVDLGAGDDRLRLQTLGAQQVDLALAADDGDDDVSIALLLPAVQKVREAAARVEVSLGAGADRLKLKTRGFDQVDTHVESDRLDRVEWL